VPSEFAGVVDVRDRLTTAGYLPDEAIETVVYLADRLRKPILVEGPAGVGKTELAKAVADARGAELIRLQCYEGLDEAKALYEWNYKKQLLRITHARGGDAPAGRPGRRSRTTCSVRTTSSSGPCCGPCVTPATWCCSSTRSTRSTSSSRPLLLEILSDFQVTIPELGTVRGTRHPFVVLTSNNTRELSEALKRRCLYLHLDYPSVEREKQIVLSRVPEAPEQLTDQLVRIVRSLRQLELKKPPSISETLDWARTLLELGYDTIDEKIAKGTMNVLLKYQQDVEKATGHLRLPPRPEMN
jgi:MoxR-like ATPase